MHSPLRQMTKLTPPSLEWLPLHSHNSCLVWHSIHSLLCLLCYLELGVNNDVNYSVLDIGKSMGHKQVPHFALITPS
jgi:hypothetical protein